MRRVNRSRNALFVVAVLVALCSFSCGRTTSENEYAVCLREGRVVA